MNTDRIETNKEEEPELITKGYIKRLTLIGIILWSTVIYQAIEQGWFN